jgi:hypothetical protein
MLKKATRRFFSICSRSGEHTDCPQDLPISVQRPLVETSITIQSLQAPFTFADQ